MPLPINKVTDTGSNIESNYGLDLSFLVSKPVEKKVVTASDKEAKILLDIWDKGEKKSKNFTLSNFDVTQRDFMRLKVSGLVEGSSESFRITSRGKKIITVMTLGESNQFLKGKKEKSYTEILASNKKSKSGYRIAQKEVKSCNLKTKNGQLTMTKEDWEKIGREAKWMK